MKASTGKIREEQIGRCGQKLDETPTELHIVFLIDHLISVQDPGVDICGQKLEDTPLGTAEWTQAVRMSEY